MSLDDIPYIGRYSKSTRGFYVASGFNKWGMTGAMTAAMILTDTILGKHNDCADVFDPSRSILKPQLLVNGLEATKKSDDHLKETLSAPRLCAEMEQRRTLLGLPLSRLAF